MLTSKQQKPKLRIAKKALAKHPKKALATPKRAPTTNFTCKIANHNHVPRTTPKTRITSQPQSIPSFSTSLSTNMTLFVPHFSQQRNIIIMPQKLNHFSAKSALERKTIQQSLVPPKLSNNQIMASFFSTTISTNEMSSDAVTQLPIPLPQELAVLEQKDPVARHHVGKRFCEAAVYNGIIHLAGQLADDLTGDITQQTQDTCANIDKFLADAGSDKAHIMSVVIYLKNMDDYQAMNAVWDNWIVEGRPPARTCVEAKLYSPDCLVEMTVYAVQKQ